MTMAGKKRPVYSDTVKREAARLYVEERISAKAVAIKLGLKAFTVKEWLSAANLIRSMSEAASLAIERGHMRGRATRTPYVSKKSCAFMYAESSYEVFRMQQLDADCDVLSWARCDLRIPYVSPDGKTRNYLPDFRVTRRDGSTVIEEVKPDFQVNSSKNRAKFAAARPFCAAMGFIFVVLTEKELGYSRDFERELIGDLAFEDKKRRHIEKCRAAELRRFAAETPEQRRLRLDRNAIKKRAYYSAKKVSGVGTNVNTLALRVSKGRA